MALSSELEALVKLIEADDPVAGKAQRELLEKNPKAAKVVGEHALRQNEFDRKLNEMKGDIESAKTIRDKWANEAKPEYDRMKGEYETVTAARQALEDKVRELSEQVAAKVEAAGGEKVDVAALATAVLSKLKGEVPTKTELKGLMEAEMSGLVAKERDQFLEVTFPASIRFNAEFTQAQQIYNKETGEILDIDEFANFIKAGKFDSPKKAFEDFMKPKRTVAQREIDGQKRADEILKERGVEFPGSSGSHSTAGHLQVRLNKRDPNDPLIAQAKIGDGSLGSLAAEELAAEGKL